MVDPPLCTSINALALLAGHHPRAPSRIRKSKKEPENEGKDERKDQQVDRLKDEAKTENIKTKHCKAPGCKNARHHSTRRGKYCKGHKTQYALEKPDQCSICLCALNKKDQPWPCGHYVHLDCIKQSLKPQCPLCRAELPLSEEDKSAILRRAQAHTTARNTEEHRIAMAQGAQVGVQHLIAAFLRDRLLQRGAIRQ